jgi:hypothetical protein
MHYSVKLEIGENFSEQQPITDITLHKQGNLFQNATQPPQRDKRAITKIIE